MQKENMVAMGHKMVAECLNLVAKGNLATGQPLMLSLGVVETGRVNF